MESILIIEDDSSILENTIEILELENYQVFTASNGQEGIIIARETKPDLILCDIHMPVKDGWQVLQELRSDINISETPFIFLTALSEKTQMQEGFDMGANGYIIKPFSGEMLLKTIQQQLNNETMHKAVN